MANRPRASRAPCILIASDQNGGLWDLQAFLSSRGYFVERTYAGTPVLERARALRPDVIILDASLTDRESLALSRTLRDDPVISPSTPILQLVSEQPKPREHLAALRAGIWELLPRPLNQNELLVKVHAYVLAKAEADLALKRESVDSVTGLYSSQGLARRAQELIFQASQHNTSAACVVFAPELAVQPGATRIAAPSSAELVRRVAEIFKAIGRRSDAIGRVGATEFAVVAPGTDAGGAIKLAERFRRSAQLGEAAPAGAAGFELRAGYAAVGNVHYTPVEPKDLLSWAARAVQMARAEGVWIRESSERSR